MARTDELISQPGLDRDPNAIFIETTDANLELLNAALAILARKNHNINLIICGPADGLVNHFPMQVISPTDVDGQIKGLLTSSTFVSTKIAAPFDETAIRAMQLNCRPVFPHTGIYPDLIPHAFHSECLYDMSAESLAGHIHEALFTLPLYRTDELTIKLLPYDAALACTEFDDRLSALATAHASAAVLAHPDRPHHLRRSMPNA